MNILLVEDEELAAEKLRGMLQELDPTIRVLAQLPSVRSAAAWLQTNRPDLIFLDIQLEDGLSFEIFDRVEVAAPVIFTTAYDEFALRAFKVNSVDYLLKPVRKEQLAAALEKFRKTRQAGIPGLEEMLKSFRDGTPSYKKRFLIEYAQKMRKVEVEEVAYFFALEKGVFLGTSRKETLPVDFTLDGLEEILDPARFFRINRKMIVACDAIRHMIPYSRARIKIELQPPEPNGVEALVSVERARAFRQWMDR